MSGNVINGVGENVAANFLGEGKAQLNNLIISQQLAQNNTDSILISGSIASIKSQVTDLANNNSMQAIIDGASSYLTNIPSTETGGVNYLSYYWNFQLNSLKTTIKANPFVAINATVLSDLTLINATIEMNSNNVTKMSFTQGANGLDSMTLTFAPGKSLFSSYTASFQYGAIVPSGTTNALEGLPPVSLPSLPISTTKQVFDNSSGSSLIDLYNPTASVSEEILNYAGLDGTGLDQSNILEWTAGGSTIDNFTNLALGETEVETSYAGIYGTGEVTSTKYDLANGDYASFAGGTDGAAQTTGGQISLALIDKAGQPLGTLAFNAATDADSLTLLDGLVVTLPNVAHDAISDTATSTLAALDGYINQLGRSLTAAALDSVNYNYLNPTGTAYTVVGGMDTYGDKNAYFNLAPHAASGAVIAGIAGYTNILSATNTDLSRDTVTGVQTLYETGTIELTGAQFNGLTSITGQSDTNSFTNATLVITTAGSYALSANDTDVINFIAQDWLGTTLTGNAQASQGLFASVYGNDTLHAGSGAGDSLWAGEGVDTLLGNAAGGDVFIANTGLAGGSKIIGLGTGNVLAAQGDISGATISGVGALVTNAIALTAAQWAGFSSVTGNGGNNLPAAGVAAGINATTGGTYSLLGKYVSSYRFNAVSSSDTTIIGNDIAGGWNYTLNASGNGNDTLTAGAADGDTLIASGNGNDTLSAGNGFEDSLTASGNGADRLTAGDGQSDTLTATGTGATTLKAGNGNYDQLTASNGTDTLIAGNGAGDSLTVTTGGNTLIAGNGAGDVFTLMGGGNIATGGAGGDAFNLYDTGNTATGGAGNDTFNLMGLSQGDQSGYTLAGSTINGGAGVNTLADIDGGTLDLGQASVGNIQIFKNMSSLALAAAQMTAATSLSFSGGRGTLLAETAGTYSLAGKDASDRVNMTDITAAGGVTLIGNDVDYETLLASATGAGDVLKGGNGAGDVLNGYNGGAETLSLGSGAGDFVFAGGANDRITLGGGAGDSVLATGNYNTITVGNGAGDSIGAAGSGDIVTGGSGGDTFLLGAAAHVYGGTGGDIFAFGLGGGDVVQGGGGSDTYAFVAGDGKDTINAYHTDAGKSVLKMAALAKNVTLSRNGNDLLASVNATTDQVTVQNYFAAGAYQLSSIQLSDTSWTAAAINAMFGLQTMAKAATLALTTSNNLVDAVGADTVTMTHGAGNRVNLAGSGNKVSDDGASGTNAIADIVSGSGNTITLAGTADIVSLNGAGDTANLSGKGDMLTLAGSGNKAVVSAATGTATVSGAKALLELTAASAETITFTAPATGTLKLDLPGSFTGTVAGMAAGDGIDLGSFLFSGHPTVSSVTGTGAVGTTTNVTVTDGATHATLLLLNQYAAQYGASPSAYTLTADTSTPNPGTLLQLATAHA